MLIMKYLLILLLLIPNFVDGGVEKIVPDVYIISIGINEYPDPFNQLIAPKYDAEAIIKKLKKDNPKTLSKEVQYKYRKIGIKRYLVDSIYTYLLTDDNATIRNIKKLS